MNPSILIKLKIKRNKVTLKKENIKGDNKDKIITNFIDSILNLKINPIVIEQDIYNSMSVCLAAEESMNANRIVKIKY